MRYVSINFETLAVVLILIYFNIRDVIAVRSYIFYFYSSQPLILSFSFHIDVGGGSVSNKTRHSLARIPLRWMIRECFKTNSGIMFNSESLVKIGLDPSTLYQDVAPRPDALTVGPSNLIRDPPATPIPINIRALSIKLEKQRNLLKELGCEEDLGTEEEEELKDALSPNHDQLSIAKFWWILEILPFVHVRQHQGGNWVRYVMYVCFKLFVVFESIGF